MAAETAAAGWQLFGVSTHSHPKVAAYLVERMVSLTAVSTHSHPKVAASYRTSVRVGGDVSTHSHPKVAARPPKSRSLQSEVSTHSHPKVAADSVMTHALPALFQHTATRRWLLEGVMAMVYLDCFNTQPPEGGCGTP